MCSTLSQCHHLMYISKGSVLHHFSIVLRKYLLESNFKVKSKSLPRRSHLPPNTYHWRIEGGGNNIG